MPSDHRSDWLALLRRLLAGAHTPLTSVAAWEAHLIASDTRPNPVVQQFLAALAREWFPASPPDDYCADLEVRVQRHVSVWHPGWPHLWAHILRVTGYALRMAPEAGVDPAAVYLMCMAHDVAKLDEYRSGSSHEELGARFAERVLWDRLDAATIFAIQAAIRKTGDGPLVHILSDADRLDKIGATGIARRISTDERWGWLSAALWRVQADDAHKLDPMHFAFSTEQRDLKREHLAWILPAAEHVLATHNDALPGE